MTTARPENQIQRFAEQWARMFPDLDVGSFVTIGSLLSLAQMLENEFRSYTRSRFGMGTGDMRILLALRRTGDSFSLRPADLYRALVVTSGAVTKQLERLTQRQLVERIPDPQRKGGWLIHLTPDGKAITDMALNDIHEHFRISTTFKQLDPAEAEAGNLFLQKLIAGYGTAAQGQP